MGEPGSVSRRDFIRTGAAAAAAAALPAVASAQDGAKTAEPEPPALPLRKLGRTGVEVTLLGQGAAFAINERHLNMMHSAGIRYIDTAKYYLKEASERAIGDWFVKAGHRKDYFLVTKDIPMSPTELVEMVDQRLVPLKTDYLDLFFLHGLGDSDHYHGAEDAKWFNDKEWIKAIEKVRSSGKCRFFGFSTHTEPIEVRIALLQAAAKGGWVDVIMVATDPVLLRDNAEFAKAVDACHEAGIGLVSMKECRGQGETDEERQQSVVKRMERVFPGYRERGLTPFTAVLNAMWSDERFASVCSHMDTIEKLTENAAACKTFKPLSAGELAAVQDMIRSSRRTYCVACDGSCRRAGHTRADLNTMARYVSYAEQDGRVHEARELLAAMSPAARDLTGADLDAASRACKCRLDFTAISRRAEELLA